MKPTPNDDARSTRAFSHLSHEERDEIAIGTSKGLTITEVSILLGRHRSTVSRELRRNGSPIYTTAYLPNRAHTRSVNRWTESHLRIRIPIRAKRLFIEAKLKEGWTPEVISGRLRMYIPSLSISHETIYQYIYCNRRDWIQYLPFSHRIRRKRGSAKGKRSIKIKNRVMIDDRPGVVDRRERIGDWEGDTIVSRESRATLVVALERLSRTVKIARAPSRESNIICRAMGGMIKSAKGIPRETLTLDNGVEFANHSALKRITGADIYFCRPYHSWEKGAIEQINGLIRRFLPKQTNFSKISNTLIARIELLLNNRPRKCLGYLTPNEVVALAT